jgi:predicted ATPase/DNA-binding SARP family transcriptional activator/class 3 adenylate cyclase
MRFAILGPLVVVDDQGREVALRLKQRAVLAVLLLHAGEVVSSDRLIDELWGEHAPATAAKTVHVYISQLRKALGEDALLTRARGYALQTERIETDVDEFRSLAADGHRALSIGDARGAAERLREALALWRGPALVDFAYEPFAQDEISRLDEARLAAVEDRIEAELALGDHGVLVGELEVLARQHPLRERICAQLMLALYRSGRQAEALDVYQRARTHLSDELGLEPGPELKALQMQVLEQASSLAADPANAVIPIGAAGVPPRPPMPLIGRSEDLAMLCGLLGGADGCLVTLVGPGGVGKTRLALEVVRAAAPSFRHGVCWVELAGVARSEDVGSTLVRALGVTPVSGESTREALLRFLTGKRLLLAIDNFEHVLAAAGLVAELHAVCHGLGLLLTSREALDLAAEQVVIVAPLAVPATDGGAGLAEIEATPGSALFLAAARRRGERFAIDATSAPTVAQICARLEGLPLALELAAARTAFLSIDELAAGLEQAVTDLGVGPRDAPERQQTLTATVEWSYRLLDEHQQAAFRRFAVFAGGATLGAATAVTGATRETLEALTAKSVLERRRHSDRSTRLQMLETIRQYALEPLMEDPDQQAVRRRHYEHYLRLAEETVPRISTHDEAAALTVLDIEIDNMSAALQWALTNARDRGVRLAGRLGGYWDIRADPEGLRWLEAALDAGATLASPRDLATARYYHAQQLGWRNDLEPAIDGLRAALSLYREAGDHAGISQTLRWLGVDLGWANNDLESRRRYTQEACRHARLAGDDRLLGQALGALAPVSGDQRVAILAQAAELLRRVGDYRQLASAYSTAAYIAISEDRLSEAADLSEVAREASRRITDPWTTIVVEGNSGLAHLFSGEVRQARQAFAHGLRITLQHALQHAFHYTVGEGLAGMAAVAAAEQRYDLAAQLRVASRAFGYLLDEFAKRIDDRIERDYIAPARAQYGAAAWERAEQAGSVLSMEQAIALAIGEPRSETRSDDAPAEDRTLATVMFTDIVASTERAAELGDYAWTALLDAHDALVRAELSQFGGTEIQFIGDGMLATFERPARAVDFGCALRDAVKTLGIEIHAGVHTGEIELRGSDIGGIAVHIAARVAALAGPSEILASQTVIDLVTGSGIRFEERGAHRLKGVPGSWPLYAVLQASDRDAAARQEAARRNAE